MQSERVIWNFELHLTFEILNLLLLITAASVASKYEALLDMLFNFHLTPDVVVKYPSL